MSAKQRNSPQTVPVQDVASTIQSIEPDIDLSRAQKFVSYCSTRLPSNAFENFVGLLQQFFQEGSQHMSGTAFVEKVRGEFKNSNGHFAELCTSLAEFMPKELGPIFRSLATTPDMAVPEVHAAALQNWAALGKAYPRLLKEVPISPGSNMDLGPDSPSDVVMGTDKLAALSDDSGSETDASVLSSPIATRLGDMRDGPAPSMTTRQDSGLIGQQLTGSLVPMSTDDLPPRAVTAIEGRAQKDGCVQYLARHADGTQVWCRKTELKHVTHLIESYNKPRCATCQKTSRRVLLAQCSRCLQYHHPGCHIPAPHRPVPTDWRCSVCMSQPTSAFMLPSTASGPRKVTPGGPIQMLTNGTDHSDTDDVQEPPRKKARLSPGQNGTSVTVAMDTASSSLIPTTTSDTSSTTTAMSDATVTVQSTGTPITITAKLEIALPTESSQQVTAQQLQLVTGQQQTVVASTAQTPAPVLHRQPSGITPAPRPRTSSKSKSGLRATKSFNSNEKLIIKFKNPAKMNANTPAGSPALGTPVTPATPSSTAGIIPMEMTSNQPNAVLSQSLGISLHVVPQSPLNKKRGRPKTPGHSKRTTASKHKTPQPGRYLPDVPLYEQAGQLWTITVFPSPVNIYDSPECTHFFGIKGIPIPRNRRRHKPATTAEEDPEAKDPSKKKKKVVGVPKKKAVAPVAASNASSKMDTSGSSETKSGSVVMQTSSDEKKTASPKTAKAVGAEVKDVKSKPKAKPGPKAAGAKQSASSKQYQPTKKRKRIYSSDLDPSALHQMRQAYQLLEKAFPILQPTPPPTPAEKLAASAAAKLAEAENKYQVVQEPALPEKGYFVCLTRNGDTVLSAAYLDEAPEDSNTNNNSKKEKERPVLRLQFFAVPVEFQRYGYGRVLANYIVDLVRASNYTLLVCSLHSAVPFWRGKNVGNFETAPDEFKAHNCFPDTQLLILRCEKCGVRCACPQIVRKGPLDGMFAKTQKAFGDLKSLGRTRSRATQKDATELTVLSPHASPRHQARRPMDILLRFPVSLSVVQVEPPTPLPSTRIALEEALDDLSD